MSALRNGPPETCFCPRCQDVPDVVMNAVLHMGPFRSRIPLGLTKRERDLYRVLRTYDGEPAPYPVMTAAVFREYETRTESDLHSLRVLASRLRKKLAPRGYRVDVESGMGYRLVLPHD